ncbi:MAG: CCA tRNA nucleotidyltransferase [Pirellulaceae bacterium]
MPPNPHAAREFAVEIVRRLRASGHEAVWAGGCVRDQLLGMQPKDYDVATSATPDEVRELFGRRRTLAIGASFGVIAVLGPRGAGQVEVATFRSDAGYSDGRHPDSVTFSTAEHDAQRRDFTINGLFFDPMTEDTIDYVGGVDDLRRGVVRAIGDPFARIAEDKLRMLRAVRFAATFDFALDADTLSAVQQQAHELVIVSAERIAAELRRMLTHRHRRRAVELLRVSGLLEIVLPEAERLYEFTQAGRGEDAWRRTLELLDALRDPTFSTSLAALLREICQPDDAVGEDVPNDGGRGCAETICNRLRLSNEEKEGAVWMLTQHEAIRRAHQSPWPVIQRLLIERRIEELLALCEALARVDGEFADGVDFCRGKLSLPAEQFDPPALISGDDLKQLGIPPGAIYRRVLDAVRDAQLEQNVATRDDALALARRIHHSLDS